ncbi:hypothetical protein TNCV_3789651 [Trichonephila clavipes]|nr:hypothetical protein TNCV_3789651 [Trichonephila clavipes]
MGTVSGYQIRQEISWTRSSKNHNNQRRLPFVHYKNQGPAIPALLEVDHYSSRCLVVWAGNKHIGWLHTPPSP